LWKEEEKNREGKETTVVGKKKRSKVRKKRESSVSRGDVTCNRKERRSTLQRGERGSLEERVEEAIQKKA